MENGFNRSEFPALSEEERALVEKGDVIRALKVYRSRLGVEHRAYDVPEGKRLIPVYRISLEDAKNVIQYERNQKK